MTKEETQALIDGYAGKIGEHCDTVLILATQSESDDKGHFTDGYSAGVGDFYSRVGMAMIYLEKNKSIAGARAAASMLPANRYYTKRVFVYFGCKAGGLRGKRKA